MMMMDNLLQIVALFLMALFSSAMTMTASGSDSGLSTTSATNYPSYGQDSNAATEIMMDFSTSPAWIKNNGSKTPLLRDILGRFLPVSPDDTAISSSSQNSTNVLGYPLSAATDSNNLNLIADNTAATVISNKVNKLSSELTTPGTVSTASVPRSSINADKVTAADANSIHADITIVSAVDNSNSAAVTHSDVFNAGSDFSFASAAEIITPSPNSNVNSAGGIFSRPTGKSKDIVAEVIMSKLRALDIHPENLVINTDGKASTDSSSNVSIIAAPSAPSMSTFDSKITAPTETYASSADSKITAPSETYTSSADNKITAPSETYTSSADNKITAPSEMYTSSIDNKITAPSETYTSSVDNKITAPSETYTSSADNKITAPSEINKTGADRKGDLTVITIPFAINLTSADSNNNGFVITDPTAINPTSADSNSSATVITAPSATNPNSADSSSNATAPSATNPYSADSNSSAIVITAPSATNYATNDYVTTSSEADNVGEKINRNAMVTASNGINSLVTIPNAINSGVNTDLNTSRYDVNDHNLTTVTPEKNFNFDTTASVLFNNAMNTNVMGNVTSDSNSVNAAYYGVVTSQNSVNTIYNDMISNAATVETVTISDNSSNNTIDISTTAYRNASNVTVSSSSDVNNTSVTNNTSAQLLDTDAFLRSVGINVHNLSFSTTPSPVKPDPCDLRAAQECRSTLIGQLRTLLHLSKFSTDVASMVPWMCQSYPGYRQCILTSANACPQARRLDYDMLLAGMDYVCSLEGSQAVGEVLPCFTSRNTSNGVQFCAQLTANTLTSQGICGVAKHYVNCVSRVYELKCSYAAGQAVRKLLHHTTAPQRAMFNCPVVVVTPPTTTTAPLPLPALTSGNASTSHGSTISLSFGTTDLYTATTLTPNASASSTKSSLQLKCYECDSGDPASRQYNSRCAVDGEISRRYFRSTLCPAPCFTRVNILPAGSVSRGCGVGLQQQFPQGVPHSGCRHLAGQFWCFCSRNGCNNRDMESHIKVELP